MRFDLSIIISTSVVKAELLCLGLFSQIAKFLHIAFNFYIRRSSFTFAFSWSTSSSPSSSPLGAEASSPQDRRGVAAGHRGARAGRHWGRMRAARSVSVNSWSTRGGGDCAGDDANDGVDDAVTRPTVCLYIPRCAESSKTTVLESTAKPTGTADG